MSTQIKDYSTALDSLAFACLHGDRPQQARAADAARAMLAASGFPVRRLRRRWFDVHVRAADGLHCWSAVANSSIDALLDALSRFEGQQVSVTVTPRGRS